MPKKIEQGFAPIIVLILAVVVGLGCFLAYQHYKDGIFFSNPSNKSSSAPEINVPKPSGWQEFTLKYGQVKISYPPKWVVKYVPYPNSPSQVAEFFPIKENSQISSERIVSLSVSQVSTPPPLSPADPPNNYYYPIPTFEKNFNIPSLGTGSNASYHQDSGITTIDFIKDNVQYYLTLDINLVNSNKLDPAEMTTIFNQMAKSISFIKVEANCDEPVLKPLDDFPNSFSLVTRHQSDQSDKIKGYWPTFTQPDYYTQESAKKDPKRIFILSYLKDGKAFQTSTEFEKTVVEIGGGTNIFDEGVTNIYYVNCPQFIGTSQDTPYTISNDQTNKFAISLWAASDNPQKLWGVEKWNTDLLKKTRGSVFIKRGDMWQKYQAQSYDVAL